MTNGFWLTPIRSWCLDVESLHQRTGVLPEALLARHECIAVVEVFHLALLEVVGETDIVVRREQQAGAFALEPLADGRDFLWRGFLLGKEVVESKHHERVGICEDPFVNRQLEARLVDALEIRRPDGRWPRRQSAGS